MPSARPLPGAKHQTPMPYGIVGDGGFGLKTWLMKPFTEVANMPKEKRIFNYRLSRFVSSFCSSCIKRFNGSVHGHKGERRWGGGGGITPRNFQVEKNQQGFPCSFFIKRRIDKERNFFRASRKLYHNFYFNMNFHTNLQHFVQRIAKKFNGLCRLIKCYASNCHVFEQYLKCFSCFYKNFPYQLEFIKLRHVLL